MEKVQAPADHPLNVACVEANRAFVAQSGVDPAYGVAGKTIR